MAQNGKRHWVILLLLLGCLLPITAVQAGTSAVAVVREDTADAQLTAALAAAKVVGKLVFLRFSEVWCSHCTRMQNILDQPAMKQIFGAEFVDLKVDLAKTPKARQLYLKYAKNGDGVPWFAFFDGDGAVLGTSVGKTGNVGCPESSEEIAFFVDMLKKITHMNADQLKQVETAFKAP